MSWLALDIGGANLKAADGLGYVDVRPFPLWRAPDRLSAELKSLIDAGPPAAGLAVTMTGELADCYESKAAGVHSILEAVIQAGGGRRVEVYLVDGRFVPPGLACERPLLAAASNWHALAAFVYRLVAQWPAVLLDMGSTTTDIIPLRADGPCAVGSTDPDRLLSGELVYTGVERTGVGAIVRQLPWRGRMCPVAAEHFATAGDAYRLLGELPESADCAHTADGRPATRQDAHRRLARMICADLTMVSVEDAVAAARAIRQQHLSLLQEGFDRVVSRLGQRPATLILSGSGEFLLRRFAGRLSWNPAVVSLNDLLGPRVSHGAPAHALGVLVRERFAENVERP